MNIFKLAYVLTVFVLFSCKKGDNDTAPAPTGSNKWYSVKAYADDTVEVKDGYLYMSTKYGSASTTKATSISSFGILKGDFELRIKYSSVEMSGTNTFSEALGFALFQSGISRALVAGNLTNEMVYVSDSSKTFPDMKSTSARAGEFYVKREGSTLNAWIKAGEEISTINKMNYTTADLRLSILISSNDATVKRTSVHIDDVSIIAGGGEVESDPFDKSSITAY